MNRQIKLGEWFLDIAKYVITAVIISSVLGDIKNKIAIYIGSGLIVVVFLFFGLILMPKKRKELKND